MKKKGETRTNQPRGFDLIERLDGSAPWKRGLTLIVFLAVVLCVLMPELVFQNKIFLVPDATSWESFASVGRVSLEKGTYPLWNPYLFCGMPSYPSLAYTPYVYPISFITHLLHTFFKTPEMMWLLLHYLMAGIGVYLLCRCLGVRPSISMLAGAAFMLMPNYLAAGANGHGSQVSSIAYMPYALYFARNIYRGRRRLVIAALLAITLGFQMLRGHIQIAYYTYLLVGLLFIFEAVYSFRKGDRRSVLVNLAVTVVVCIAAVGIAAVLVIPVRDYADLSIRGGGAAGGLDYGYATGWSLHPKEMLTFAFPWAYGFGKATYWGEMPFTDYPNYLGAVTVVFCLLALALVRDRWKWFLVITALIATVVGFGRFFPILYKPMFELLPFFNKFRVPVMILFVQQLALVALMGMGIEAFVRRMRDGDLPSWLRPPSMKWIVIGGVVVFLLVLVGSGSITDSVSRQALASGKVRGEVAPLAGEAYTTDLVKTIALYTLLAAIVYFAVRRGVLPGALILALAFIAVVDLFVVANPILHPEEGWKNERYRIIRSVKARENYKKPDEVVNFLKTDDSYFRVFPAPAAPLGRWSHSTPPFSDNRFMISRIFSLGGYHAAKLKNYQDVMDTMFGSFNKGIIPLNILSMLNAKYILATAPLLKESQIFPLVWQQGNMHVYENTAVCPRVFLVDSFRVMERDRIPGMLLTSGFDPSREVLLSEPPAVIPESVEGSSVEIVDYRLNGIVVNAHIERPCLLVMSEIDYPDWRAVVDGEETRILTANYCLRALPLTPGDHEIHYIFKSDILITSLIISIVVFCVVVLVPVIHAVVAREEDR